MQNALDILLSNKKNEMMKAILCMAVLLSVLSSCSKREVPSSNSGQPVFMFKGTIGGDSVNLEAGVNNIYMFTGFFKDTQNLVTLKSYLAKDNCTNCEPYLSFEVKDIDASNSNFLVSKIEDLFSGNTFKSFSLDSIVSTTNVETFTFIPEFLTGNHQWDFGDGVTSTLASPTHVFSTGGIKSVRHIYTTPSISDTIINQINVDFQSPCRPQFSYVYDSITHRVDVAANQGFTSYLWNFGNGTIGLGQVDSNIYNNPGVYTITLTASNSSCNGSTFKKKLSASFFNQIEFANYNYTTSSSTLTSVIPRLNKSAFIITWIKNGKDYRSYKNIKGINQSGNPVFTFTDFSFYDPNAKGEKTIKVRGTVDTYLYNYADANDSIKIKSNNIVLAAAYP